MSNKAMSLIEATETKDVEQVFSAYDQLSDYSKGLFISKVFGRYLPTDAELNTTQAAYELLYRLQLFETLFPTMQTNYELTANAVGLSQLVMNYAPSESRQEMMDGLDRAVRLFSSIHASEGVIGSAEVIIDDITGKLESLRITN